jgi:hypothetical protein
MGRDIDECDAGIQRDAHGLRGGGVGSWRVHAAKRGGSEAKHADGEPGAPEAALLHQSMP